MTFFNKYVMCILKKTEQGYIEVKRKKFEPTDPTVTYEKGTYHVDLDAISYRRRWSNFLYVDYDTGDTLTFAEIKASAAPKDAETQNLTKLARAALSVVGGDFGLVMLVAMLGVGLAVGFILGQNIEGISGAFHQ